MRPKIILASSGVAGSIPNSLAMRTILATCSPLLFAILAFFKVEVILQTYADISADEQGLGADGELGSSCDADGKLEIPDLLLGIIHEKHEILRARRDAAQDAHDELDVNGFLDIACLDQEGDIVYHPGVIDLELGLRSVFIENIAVFPHGLEGIGEDEVLRHAEILFLPFKFPFLVSRDNRKEARSSWSLR